MLLACVQLSADDVRSSVHTAGAAGVPVALPMATHVVVVHAIP